MKHPFVAKVTIEIDAPIEKVWDALTNPALIKQYFFGTEAISDWKVGSTLLFKGEWEGKEYVDKGTILKLEKPNLLKYDYLSSLSNLDDLPENYAAITYELSHSDGKTILNILQDNIATEEARDHSQENWAYIMGDMKKLVEEGSKR